MRSTSPSETGPSVHVPLLFLLFVISGFCSLVYEVVWLRLAFAWFGIITPIVSVVLSMFMLGLAVGCWGAGRWIKPLTIKTGIPAGYYYALSELGIGMSAFTVPLLFKVGARALLGIGEMESAKYLFLSALVLAVAVLPWCMLMGATFPLMLAHIKEVRAGESEGFSRLYLANVLGAMAGTLLTALVLVELFGFHGTLRIAAAGNFFVAAVAVLLARFARRSVGQKTSEPAPWSAGAIASMRQLRSRLNPAWILFWTGFGAMGMEVVWMRMFTPWLKTQVYSFASVLAIYLGATCVGAFWYRREARQGRRTSLELILGLLGCAAFLPALLNDPRILSVNSSTFPDFATALVVLAGIVPICAFLGYLTPQLVDSCGQGAPDNAGRAYAVNVLGSILGPLVASYLLLPRLSDRFALLLLGSPFLLLFFRCPTESVRLRRGLGCAVVLTFGCALLFSRSFEEYTFETFKESVLRRDYAASVLSTGEGREKRLLVNGMGMTALTPITKFMVHLPLALQKETPHSALIICFGMGTTFRSGLSWGVQTTAVELVPSVRDAFGFYHSDAGACLSSRWGRIVIDDGRRFLLRTKETYDVIVVDPPPPSEAAGVSLLYSREFYQLAKAHLKPNGILQAWVPANWGDILESAARSMQQEFPYVRCFKSIEHWGYHILGSIQPIEVPDLEVLDQRFPAAARADLLEWGGTNQLTAYLGHVLRSERPLWRLLNPNPNVEITDDRPYNEYFLLRRKGLVAARLPLPQIRSDR